MFNDFDHDQDEIIQPHNLIAQHNSTL